MVCVREVKTKKKDVLNLIRKIIYKNEIIDKTAIREILKSENIVLEDSTFRNYIQELKNLKYISSIKKGVYTTSIKSKYFPDINKKLVEIFLPISKEMIIDRSCIWETSWLNEFMIHQAMSSKIILEVDPDVLESVYYFIKDNVYKKVFINPDEKIIHQYISGESEPLILLPIIGRSPLKHINKITIPKLEKILVDVFSNTVLYYWLQGQEFINIFTNAYEKYQMNFSILFSYASRRGTDKKLKNFLLDKTDIPEELIG